MTTLWIPYGFPMDFLWRSYASLWVSFGFPMISYEFPMTPHGFGANATPVSGMTPYGVHRISYVFGANATPIAGHIHSSPSVYGFPMDFPWISYGFPMNFL